MFHAKFFPQAAFFFLTAATALAAESPQTAPAPATTPAPASYPATARALVETLDHDVLAILRDPKLERLEKRRKVRELAYQYIDFDVLSRLTLGQNWRTLTDAQRAQFVQEFKLHLSATYGHTTDEYTDEDMNLVSDRQEANGDWTVLTRVMGTKEGTRQEIAKLEYRLRKNNGLWKIIDVTIDSVSLMSNFRNQFQEIMNNGGVDKLIKLLHDKNAAADK